MTGKLMKYEIKASMKLMSVIWAALIACLLYTSMFKELYSRLPPKAHIANVTATGYGEGLIKAAFKADLGEIETMAHYKASEEFLPGVDFILDIGGQDMKCMRIKDGACLLYASRCV